MKTDDIMSLLLHVMLLFSNVLRLRVTRTVNVTCCASVWVRTVVRFDRGPSVVRLPGWCCSGQFGVRLRLGESTVSCGGLSLK